MTNDIRHQTSDIRGAKRARYSFRDLAVWQKAQQLAIDVLRLVRGLPNDRTTAILAQQLLRAATSIAANIAEGHGRFTPATYRNHLSIARGSANETLSWLDLLKRDGLITPNQELPLVQGCDEVLRMISAQMISLDKPQDGRSGTAAPRRRSDV